MSNAKRMLGQVINEQQIKKELGEKYRGTYLGCCPLSLGYFSWEYSISLPSVKDSKSCVRSFT